MSNLDMAQRPSFIYTTLLHNNQLPHVILDCKNPRDHKLPYKEALGDSREHEWKNTSLHESSADIWNTSCTVWGNQKTRGHSQSYWFVVCPTHVHSVQAKVLVLVLISPHCSFYQSNTHSDEHLHTDRQTGSLNMKWMTDSSCQATESGKLSVHTHTLTIQALFGNVIFSPLKGVPCVSASVCVFQCVCVYVCFSWMLTPLGLSPTWFFQKPNRLKRAQLHDLSLSLPFPPSLFL